MIDQEFLVELLVEYEVRGPGVTDVYGPFNTDEMFGEENMETLAGPVTAFLERTVEETHEAGCDEDLTLVMAGFLQGLAIGWQYRDES